MMNYSQYNWMITALLYNLIEHMFKNKVNVIRTSKYLLLHQLIILIYFDFLPTNRQLSKKKQGVFNTLQSIM